MANRKGFSKRSDVPLKLVQRLSRGQEASQTLAESLVVRHSVLLGELCKEIPKSLREAVDGYEGILPKMRAGAELLVQYGDEKILAATMQSPSDTALGYVAFAYGLTGELAGPLVKLTLAQRLAAVRPLAEHEHYGVREWAWLGVRPRVAAEITHALVLLSPWTGEGSSGLRRFASEMTRPRGVWCKRIPELVASPQLGLVILNPLRADPAKYVQLSVGNWLNDASKDNPDWVRSVTAKWNAKKATVASRAATAVIVNRGLRTLAAE